MSGKWISQFSSLVTTARFPHVLLSLVQQQSIPKARSDNFTTGLLKYVPSLKTNISPKKARPVHKELLNCSSLQPLTFRNTFVSFPGGVGLLKLVSWLFQETCATLLEKTMVDYSSSLRPINVWRHVIGKIPTQNPWLAQNCGRSRTYLK